MAAQVKEDEGTASVTVGVVFTSGEKEGGIGAMSSAKCIEKGETITCENGHEICRAVADVYLGQTDWHWCFGYWEQEEPRIGGPWPTCNVCGSEVFQFPNVWVGGKKRMCI